MFEELGGNLVSDLSGAKVLSNEESLPTHRLIDLWILFHEFLEFFHEIGSLLLCHLREVISESDMQTCDRCRAGEGSSSCRRGMYERIRVHHALPDFFCRDKCRYRHHATTESFSHRHDIWNDSPVIHSPHLSRTSDTCLNFVSDEEYTMFRRRRSDTWPEVIGWHDRTCFSLDRFHHDSCDTDSDGFTYF